MYEVISLRILDGVQHRRDASLYDKGIPGELLCVRMAVMIASFQRKNILLWVQE